MPTEFFTRRPVLTGAMQWTGDNFTEVEAFVEAGNWTVVEDNGDGTLTMTTPWDYSWVVEQGQYVGVSGDILNLVEFQQVSPGTSTYVVQ